MQVVFTGERPAGRLRKLLRVLFFLSLTGLAAGLIVGLVAYATFSHDVPNFESLDDYRPKIVTQVYGQEGQLIGEFYRERRIYLPLDQIPPKVWQAFLASEDDGFFEHSGIDYWGIVRAAVANLKAGRVVQGGSTITQQVAKSLIISQEGYEAGSAKKFSRKIKEAILAQRLEKKLQKDEILGLYLNQIFLGNQAYGIQAAAQNYFRKNVDQLNVAEIALLAGLPQAPSRYSPITHPKRAKDRREYVLRRMLEEKFITEAELNEAKETPLLVHRAPNFSRDVTPFFTEHVRRLLVEKYGEDKVLNEGLQVWTTVDVERYRGAEDASYENLRQVDKRQGYRGPLARYPESDDRAKFLAAYTKELEYLGRATEVIDGQLYVAVVQEIDRAQQLMKVQVGPFSGILPLAAMRWARAVDPTQWFESALISSIPKTFAVGDALLVRATTVERIKKDRFASAFLKSLPTDKTPVFSLEQEPNLETALLSVEGKSGYVLAMLGGYSYDRSEFNRALQACRQPGSSFKPIVYSAALALNKWTASTRVLDAPLTFYDDKAEKAWKPSNFDSKSMGEVTLRTALQNSMNVPAIRVLDGVGLGPAIAYAHKLGIQTELKMELGLALGSSCVTMDELSRVYSLLSNNGVRVQQNFVEVGTENQKTAAPGHRFITRVVDRDGKVLFDDGAPFDAWAGIGLKVERAEAWVNQNQEQVIDAPTAFLTTRLMRNVVLGGTGTGAQRLGVPVAGKTGTTNDSFDAWFVGFTTDITTAVWVGYDDYVIPMGKYEQGGRAALPIWVDYMKVAVKKKTGEFEPPPGVVSIRIDPKTGMRAREDTLGAVVEYYRSGSEPAEFVARAGEARPDQFFMVDN